MASLKIMREVIAESRDMIRPTARQHARAKGAAENMLRLIAEETADRPEIIDVELGGSYRKDTWLARPEMDIDVYLRFDCTTSPERFKSISIDVGRAALRDYSPYLRFSEHPYVEAKLDKNILANVVPCYDVAMGKWRSAADRSRFHTRYMSERLTRRMRDDVRLLKAFLKANNLYGAQIAKNGFSGYVAETLIVYHESFENTIRGFAEIKPGAVIGEATKKFDSIIPIIDPIDGDRNLAAAISDESLVRFILACRAFVKEPSAEFFDRRSMKKGRRRGGAGAPAKYWDNMLVVRFGFKQRAPDIIWGQAKKSASKLARRLERDGFTVIRYKAHVETGKRQGYLFVLLGSTTIPARYVQRGPEFFMRENLDAYIQKSLADSAMLWVDSQGRLSALKKREWTSACSHARHILKEGGSRTTLMPDAWQAKVWTGRSGGELSGAAKEAAEELISTDASIVRLS